MKKILVLVLVAFLGGMISIGVYKLFGALNRSGS